MDGGWRDREYRGFVGILSLYILLYTKEKKGGIVGTGLWESRKNFERNIPFPPYTDGRLGGSPPCPIDAQHQSLSNSHACTQLSRENGWVKPSRPTAADQTRLLRSRRTLRARYTALASRGHSPPDCFPPLLVQGWGMFLRFSCILLLSSGQRLVLSHEDQSTSP